MYKYNEGFTLAEILITVVILGILAAILVPNLIKNQVENANRTKVKKAMASYEKAINYMIIENDIRETEALRELGQDNCQYTREYFKTVKDGENNCIFKTADRVWWNITDLTNPIIILKDSQKDKSTTELQTLAKNVSDKTVFALIGRFDDVSTLRVNDNAYEQGLNNNLANQKYMKKLWHFITQNDSLLNAFDICKKNKQSTCIITNADGKEVEYELVSLKSLSRSNTLCIYDETSKSQVCDYISTANAGDYYIKKYNGSSTEYCNSSLATAARACAWPGNYWLASKLTCEADGTRVATAQEILELGKQGQINPGYYWAFEEKDREGYTGYFTRTDYPGIYSNKKNFKHNSLCIAE